MTRHLLLDAIEHFDESEQISIFVPLRDYSEAYDNLFDYTYEKFEMLGGCSDPDDFAELLENGSCLLGWMKSSPLSGKNSNAILMNL